MLLAGKCQCRWSAAGGLAASDNIGTMNISRITLWILLAASICWTGCEMFASHTNPIEGWQADFKHEPSQAIENDYQDYIQKLPPGERPFASVGGWFKDATGQHAINIEIALDGTWWNHVLIYDKDNKRIKVIKYVGGHYRC